MAKYFAIRVRMIVLHVFQTSIIAQDRMVSAKTTSVQHAEITENVDPSMAVDIFATHQQQINQHIVTNEDFKIAADLFIIIYVIHCIIPFYELILFKYLF